MQKDLNFIVTGYCELKKKSPEQANEFLINQNSSLEEVKTHLSSDAYLKDMAHSKILGPEIGVPAAKKRIEYQRQIIFSE